MVCSDNRALYIDVCGESVKGWYCSHAHIKTQAMHVNVQYIPTAVVLVPVDHNASHKERF